MRTTKYGIDIDSCRDNFRARQEQLFHNNEARRMAARKSILHALASVLPDYAEVRRVYLFGSVTHAGTFHSDSDIDVAVEGTKAEILR